MSGRRLLLLRHGQTTAGNGVLLGSRSDPGLSPRGREQAAAAGNILRRHAIAGVMCSPLRRARETAAFAFPGLAFRVDERWRELDFGLLTGLTWEEAKARHGSAAIAWRREAASPPEGEAPVALRARVLAAVFDALDELDGGPHGDVVVVSHATPIRTIVGSARGWALADQRRIQVTHGGLRVVRAGARTLQRWNPYACPLDTLPLPTRQGVLT
jgi:probable phosphoglycerate mutase